MFKALFNIFDPAEENALKERLVELSGVNKKYINFLKITIENDEYVHVTMIDDYTQPNKPILVLLHGLTGTSFCFFTMFKNLSKHFTVYAIDLPGQGLSSRIPYDFLDREKAEEFFLKRFYMTFKALKIKKMILLAHSFSGYLAGLFYIKYPDMIDHLIFLSPIGLCSSNKELGSCNAIENLVQSMAFKFKRGPNVGIKLFGFLSRPIFNKYCERSKFRALNDEEYDVYKGFLYCQVQKDYSSDSAVYSFFDKNLKAYKPLSLFIENFRALKGRKILIAYGAEDWCPSINGEEFQKLLGRENVELITISKSNHMMQTDNYVELLEKLNDFFIKEKIIEAQ